MKKNNPDSLWSKKITVGVMAFLILVPGCLGFGEKLYQFFIVLHKSPEGSFAIVPIATYLLVSFGFVLIFIWGMHKGMLSDMEGPKYYMLINEEKLDAKENNSNLGGLR